MFVLAGCSGAVRIPRADLGAESDKTGLYKITTTETELLVWKFVVNDSALVVTEFAEDANEKAEKTVPVSIPLDRIESVERLETTGSGMAVIGVVVVVVAVMILAYKMISDAAPDTD